MQVPNSSAAQWASTHLFLGHGVQCILQEGWQLLQVPGVLLDALCTIQRRQQQQQQQTISAQSEARMQCWWSDPSFAWEGALLPCTGDMTQQHKMGPWHQQYPPRALLHVRYMSAAGGKPSHTAPESM